MDQREKKFRAFIDNYGKLYITTKPKSVLLQDLENESIRHHQYIKRECAAWLKFITIFWNMRVLKTAVRLGLAALIMNRYERVGLAILMLCVAL